MKYISIGQFSKRTSLSIRALRLYDAEQLLQPSRVDPITGYRYYTADQLGIGQLIRKLRSCEMPLDQLKLVLQEPQRARDALLNHKTHLEQRLLDHQQMLDALNTLILEGSEDFKVELKAVAAQPILLIRQTLDWTSRHENGAIGRGIAALQAYARPNDHAGEPFLMYGCKSKSMNDILICGPVKSHYQSQGEIEAAELPSTQLAFTTHHGSYTTMQATLERLLRWILSQGLNIVGDARETYLKHPANSGSLEEYRTELAIPVERTVTSDQLKIAP